MAVAMIFDARVEPRETDFGAELVDDLGAVDAEALGELDADALGELVDALGAGLGAAEASRVVSGVAEGDAGGVSDGFAVISMLPSILTAFNFAAWADWLFMTAA